MLKKGNPTEEIAFEVFLRHPLPWRIDRDWAYEVISSDNAVVAKCMTRQDAEAVIEWAEQTRARLDDEAAHAEATTEWLESIAARREAENG